MILLFYMQSFVFLTIFTVNPSLCLNTFFDSRYTMMIICVLVHVANNRHITAANFFIEPVDSSVHELLIIDRLTSEITLTSMCSHTLHSCIVITPWVFFVTVTLL